MKKKSLETSRETAKTRSKAVKGATRQWRVTMMRQLK